MIFAIGFLAWVGLCACLVSLAKTHVLDSEVPWWDR